MTEWAHMVVSVGLGAGLAGFSPWLPATCLHFPTCKTGIITEPTPGLSSWMHVKHTVSQLFYRDRTWSGSRGTSDGGARISSSFFSSAWSRGPGSTMSGSMARGKGPGVGSPGYLGREGSGVRQWPAQVLTQSRCPGCRGLILVPVLCCGADMPSTEPGSPGEE